MIEILFYNFIEAWMLGLIAFIAGRYVGQGHVKLPTGMGRIFLMYLQVWAVTFVGKVAFGFLGHSLQWEESTQSGFAEFLLPIAVGAYFARQLLLLAMQRGKQ
ncbi:MAG: hypothetical protein NTW90_01090 [Nitrosospira sp.]|nr:hypothetical protein [Nitrosospira sp.]